MYLKLQVPTDAWKPQNEPVLDSPGSEECKNFLVRLSTVFGRLGVRLSRHAPRGNVAVTPSF